MDRILNNISQLYESSQTVVEQHIKVAKLETYERATNLISSGVSSAILLIFGLFAFMFLNLSGAYLLSEYLHSKALGFLVVGLIHTVLLIVYMVFRKQIGRNAIKNVVLAKISKDTYSYDELLEMQKQAYADIEYSKNTFKENVSSLRDNLGITSLLNIKNGIAQNSLKKIMLVALIRLGVNKVLLRNTNPITKFLVGFASDATITSGLLNSGFWNKIINGAKHKLAEVFSKSKIAKTNNNVEDTYA